MPINFNEIIELKEEGHRLLDEYKEITGFNSERAYEELKKRMNGRPFHFASMKEKQDVRVAVGSLKKMIAKVKYEKSLNRSL